MIIFLIKMNKSQIINKLKEYLNFKTDTEFAKFLGIKQNTVSSWRSRDTIDYELIISKCDTISAEWLLTGKGDMLKKEGITQETRKNEVIPRADLNVMYVPIVSQYAYAGYLGGFDDPGYMNTLPTQPIPVERELKGKYVFFEVKGDSMDNDTADSLKEGDLALCQEVDYMFWKYKLNIKRWYYVIVHKIEGVIIKQIKEHNVEKGIIKVHSLNELYKDQEISLNEVVQLFTVEQILRKFKG